MKQYKFGADSISHTSGLNPGRYLVASATGASLFVLDANGWHPEKGKKVVSRPNRVRDGVITTTGTNDPVVDRSVWRV